MAHRQKETKGLSNDQVKEMRSAWAFAAMIGLPLNALVSIRPSDIDMLSPKVRCARFSTLRNKFGVYARGQQVPPTFVWSRETSIDGSGEHMHVLIHVPAQNRPHFEELVTGWYPQTEETDIRTAHQRIRIVLDGKQFSAIGYVVKQMVPQAAFKRPLIRKPGGPILGKRGGVTLNLSQTAIDAYRSTRPRSTGSLQGGVQALSSMTPG